MRKVEVNLTVDDYLKMKDKNMLDSEIAAKIGCSTSGISNWKKRNKVVRVPVKK
ncbi:hypothetical protein ACYRFT_12875 [Listeria kieliensis]